MSYRFGVENPVGLQELQGTNASGEIIKLKDALGQTKKLEFEN